MDNGAIPCSQPPKKKKLPFKPTALRRTAAPPIPTPSDDDDSKKPDTGDADDDHDDLQLFRRSKEMAPIVAADYERRLRKKQRLDEERRRRRSSGGAKRALDEEDAEVQEAVGMAMGRMGEEEALVLDDTETAAEESFRELVTPPPSKRSRLESASAHKHIDTVQETENIPFDSPSTRLLRSISKTAGPSRAPISDNLARQNTNIISVDSDSDEDIKVLATPTQIRHRSTSAGIADPVSPSLTGPPPPQPSQGADGDEDDDEFAEYVRKAEEQRARDRAAVGKSSAPGGDQPQRDKVDILISSEVDGSKPCCMRTLFDKPLRVVRDTWVAVQRQKGIQLGIEQNDDVVLTWRRKKVYMSSSLLNLGIRPEGNGRVTADGYDKGGISDNRTRVHMEAWPPELFRQMEQEEEIRRKREAGELDDDEDGPPAAPEETPEPEVRIRVILRARDMPDVKLTVRPETTVETLLTGFRTQRDVGSDKEVSLRFDGDRLEEHTTMDAAEIDDMDTIEVHIK